MHYQTLIDLVMASPSQPQMAAKSGLLLNSAAQQLGRHASPELSGIVPTVARPNVEQVMSGEFHAGRLAAAAQPQFHSLDPLLPLPIQSAARGLLPAVAWHAVPDQSAGVAAVRSRPHPSPSARSNPARFRPAAQRGLPVGVRLRLRSRAGAAPPISLQPPPALPGFGMPGLSEDSPDLSALVPGPIVAW